MSTGSVVQQFRDGVGDILRQLSDQFLLLSLSSLREHYLVNPYPMHFGDNGDDIALGDAEGFCGESIDAGSGRRRLWLADSCVRLEFWLQSLSSDFLRATRSSWRITPSPQMINWDRRTVFTFIEECVWVKTALS